MTIETVMTSKEDMKPAIILSAEDYERLTTLARAARKRMPALADELAEEVARARVLAKGQQPKDVVCMNSEVEFRDDGTVCSGRRKPHRHAEEHGERQPGKLYVW